MSRTPLQLKPKVQRGILPEIFGPMQVAGEGASDSGERGEDPGALEHSVSGGGIFVDHNKIAARLSQVVQESRQYKNSIGRGALERWSVTAWSGQAGSGRRRIRWR